MSSQLMLIHKAFLNELDLEYKNMLSIERHWWDWDWTEKTEEFASHIIFMDQVLKKGQPLPHTPYSGKNYGRDVLLAESVLSSD